MIMLKKRNNIESYDDLCIGDRLVVHCNGNVYYDKHLVQVLIKKPFKTYNGACGDTKNSMYEIHSCSVLYINGFEPRETWVVLNVEDFDYASGMYNENLFDINDIFSMKIERYFE